MTKELAGKILAGLGAFLILIGAYVFTEIPEEKYTPSVPVEKALSELEAHDVIIERIENVLAFYENPENYFKVIGNGDDIIEVSDYNEVVKTIFSDKGIKGLETIKFDGKSFITKNNNTVSILKTIPDNKKYKDQKMTLKGYKLYAKLMIVNVTFETSYMGENGIPNAILTTVGVKLIKSDGVWLIDEFNYNEL